MVTDYDDTLLQKLDYLCISLETDGVGPFNTQKVIRVALLTCNAQHEIVTDETFFVQGATCLHYNPNQYTPSQIEQGLTPGDAGDLINTRISQVVLENKGWIVAHNMDFIDAQLHQLGVELHQFSHALICTMKQTVDICELGTPIKGRYKYPQLMELYNLLFPEQPLEQKHFWKAEHKVHHLQQCFSQLLQFPNFKQHSK